MKGSSGHSGYNAHGYGLTHGDRWGSDKHAGHSRGPANDALLVPMMEQAEETTGTKSQMTLADAGYFAASHLAECDRRGQKVVVSRQRFLEDPYHKQIHL